MEISTISELISTYGFPIVMSVGLGYYIYFIWDYINEHIEPELDKMHFALIRVIDQTRMLDQDLIRLQQKVNVIVEYKAQQDILQVAKEKEAFKILQEKTQNVRKK